MEIPIFNTSEREQVIEVTGSAEEMDIQSEDFSLEDGVREMVEWFKNRGEI